MNMPTLATALLCDIKAKRGLSEVALARRLKISQPTVNRILRGKSDCKSSTFVAIQAWWNELAQQKEIA
ncbi:MULTISPECIES: helix-turn-helix domain-containing protein [Burkholderia cepacia complex]|jgi:predicted transcriptional regulator|uniref:helix-turn-helix domain-containing protein n=1 Tax=Burkholderia cepacia complex TaxID=87882 RepID=UPI00158D4869|nr:MULTISPECIES: helix-turn-helix transcriptional regulator [Burkholderia cepacia complex]MCA8037877.1 helix-turn-helix transcriptional regulator [Burkholderia arboris]